MKYFCTCSFIGLGQDPMVRNAKEEKKCVILALCTRNGSCKVFVVKHSQGIPGVKQVNL